MGKCNKCGGETSTDDRATTVIEKMDAEIKRLNGLMGDDRIEIEQLETIIGQLQDKNKQLEKDLADGPPCELCDENVTKQEVCPVCWNCYFSERKKFHAQKEQLEEHISRQTRILTSHPHLIAEWKE